MSGIAVFHYGYKYIKHVRSSPNRPFFSITTSAYYTNGEVNPKTVFQIFLRSLIVLAVRMVLVLVYIYAFEGGINVGIIATIYMCSSITFTLLIFYFMYNQKLTKIDMLGFLFIFASVILIGNGASQREDVTKSKDEYKHHEAVSLWHFKLTDNDQTFYFVFAIFLALCFGCVNGINASQVKNVEQFHKQLSLEQLNIDGELICGLYFLPFFLYELMYDE